MSWFRSDSRQAVSRQLRLGGEAIFLPRLDDILQGLKTAVVPSTNSEGVDGWRLRRDPPGVASLFFATGPEKPDSSLIETALRTVEELALDHDAYSVTIKVKRDLTNREPELDIYIRR
jgi:hypothetical protein